MLCGLMTRLEKLNECLAIARKHNNTFMEQNILMAIKSEKENPSDFIYPDEEAED